MSPDLARIPPHIVDNRARYASALERSRTATVSSQVVFQLFWSVLPYALDTATTALGAPPDHPLAPYPPLLWVLCGLPLFTAAALHQALRARHPGLVDLTTGLHSFIILSWTLLLTYEILPNSPVLATIAFLGLVSHWAWHESQQHYERGAMRLIHLAAGVLATALVAGIAILPELRVGDEPPTLHLLQFVCLDLFGLGYAQFLLRREGQRAREADLFADQQAKLKQRLGVMQAERHVIQATTALLVPGLQAAQIAHDMASPLAAVQSGLALVKEHHLADDPEAQLSDEELRRTLLSAEDAARRLRHMLQDLMQGISRDRPLEQRDATELMTEAIRAMQRTLHDRGKPPVEVTHDIEDARVFVTIEHLAALTNILVNGATQHPAGPLELRTTRLNNWFYGVEIRDHGVIGDEQRTAYERVRRILSLKPKTAPSLHSGLTESSSHRGFGVALTLAKILLVRYNGWLGVRTPESGPGLLFQMVLPLRDPAEIPPLENQPEEAWAMRRPRPRSRRIVGLLDSEDRTLP